MKTPSTIDYGYCNGSFGSMTPNEDSKSVSSHNKQSSFINSSNISLTPTLNTSVGQQQLSSPLSAQSGGLITANGSSSSFSYLNSSSTSLSNSSSPQASSNFSSTSTAPNLKEFNKSAFQALVCTFSRLFCDDEQIVLLDFFCNEEKAFTEKDLLERLGWPEKRLREVCASLEKEKFIIKEQLNMHSSNVQEVQTNKNTKISYKDSSKSDKILSNVGNTPYHYRINSHLGPVLQFRCQKIESLLELGLEECQREDRYICINCKRQFDTLQAQGLELHPEDAHFLCKCGSPLAHEDNANDVNRLINLQKECKEALQPVRTAIEKIWGMNIPTFLPISKALEEDNKWNFSNSSQTKNKPSSLVGSTLSNSTSNPSESNRSIFKEEKNNFKLEIDSEETVVKAKAIPMWLQKSSITNSSFSQLFSSTKNTHHLPSSSVITSQQTISSASSKPIPSISEFTSPTLHTSLNTALNASKPVNTSYQETTISSSSRSQVRFSFKGNKNVSSTVIKKESTVSSAVSQGLLSQSSSTNVNNVLSVNEKKEFDVSMNREYSSSISQTSLSSISSSNELRKPISMTVRTPLQKISSKISQPSNKLVINLSSSKASSQRPASLSSSKELQKDDIPISSYAEQSTVGTASQKQPLSKIALKIEPPNNNSSLKNNIHSLNKSSTKVNSIKISFNHASKDQDANNITSKITTTNGLTSHLSNNKSLQQQAHAKPKTVGKEAASFNIQQTPSMQNIYSTQHSKITHNSQKTDDSNKLLDKNVNNSTKNSYSVDNDEEQEPSLYISKFKHTYRLSEAQYHQQAMTQEEFEKFTELQDYYLNVF